ncbi:ankyrin repeat-containing domain protein [Lophiotrema nucula]|uniref:Ankyrin repeat-containing domain protein n=1 Tax=Lophiotrema nucula TaxID=690887 RepID=A0A6A5YZJ4_9PLEO|nr:ankyrin repeat-containing domain protein [Lophiotrema nucula]
MAIFLLDNGANASLAHETGTTPLHLLPMFPPEHIPNIGARLIDSGADVSSRTRQSLCWEVLWHGISLSGGPLPFAVACRNSSAVATLLALGADPNQGYLWWSSLDLAASLCMPEICELLIGHGATATKQWFRGRSPLHWMGVSTFASLLGKFLTHGSAYQSAIRSTIDVLIASGAVIDEEDDWKTRSFAIYGISYTPLGNAAANPRADPILIRCLLERCISSQKSVPVEVLFGAIHASKDNHLSCVAFDILYECPSMSWYQVPGHQVRRHDGETILHNSAKKDAVAALKQILLHPNLDVDALNDLGLTALHNACQWASNECVELLIERGANMEIQTQFPELNTTTLHYTALGFLIKAKRVDLVVHAIDMGADMWLGNKSNGGPTYLHLAVSVRTVERVYQSSRPMLNHMESLLSLPQEESLLVTMLEGPLSEAPYETLKQAKSILNAVCPQLGTALHVAVMCGAHRAAEALLDLGVDPNVTDQQGRTPLDCLEEFNESTRTGYVIVSQDVHTYIEEMSSLLWEAGGRWSGWEPR